MITYPVEVSLAIVLLPSVHVVVDGDEGGAAATTVLGAETEHGDAVLSRLELLGNLGLDGGALHAGLLGVDQLNGLETK